LLMSNSLGRRGSSGAVELGDTLSARGSVPSGLALPVLLTAQAPTAVIMTTAATNRLIFISAACR
jgi:hypothetical protein